MDATAARVAEIDALLEAFTALFKWQIDDYTLSM